jgi:hypothetical protein
VQRAPNNILVTRWTIDQPAPPIFVKAGDFIGNVDCRQMIGYTPPVFLHPDVGATPTGTGAPEGRRVGEISMRSLNAITLETVTFGVERRSLRKSRFSLRSTARRRCIRTHRRST